MCDYEEESRERNKSTSPWAGSEHGEPRSHPPVGDQSVLGLPEMKGKKLTRFYALIGALEVNPV